MGIGVFFKTLLTGKDNASFDIGRVLWALDALVFLALEVHAVVWQVPFDGMMFAQASGLILAAGGVALGAKAHSEPDKTP